MERTGAGPAAVMGKRPSAGRPALAQGKAKRKRPSTAPAGRRDGEANGKIAKRGCGGERGEKTSERGPPQGSATSGRRRPSTGGPRGPGRRWPRAAAAAGTGSRPQNEEETKRAIDSAARLADGNESGETTEGTEKTRGEVRGGGTGTRMYVGSAVDKTTMAPARRRKPNEAAHSDGAGPAREKTGAGRARAVLCGRRRVICKAIQMRLPPAAAQRDARERMWRRGGDGRRRKQTQTEALAGC